jgi:hypothetical protein
MANVIIIKMGHPTYLSTIVYNLLTFLPTYYNPFTHLHTYLPTYYNLLTYLPTHPHIYLPTITYSPTHPPTSYNIPTYIPHNFVTLVKNGHLTTSPYD